ncbi:hypothetical protein AB6D60_22435 [Vibrio splendidus]
MTIAYLLEVIFIYFFLINILGYFGVEYYRSTKNFEKNEGVDVNRRIIFAVPVHNEVNAFINSLKFWLGIFPDNENWHLVFVTQNICNKEAVFIREHFESSANLNGKKNIQLIFDKTSEFSTKVTKLNSVTEELMLSDNDYLGVFDIDTRIKKITFLELEESISNGSDVIQIVPISTAESSNILNNSLLFFRNRRNLSLEYGLTKLANVNSLYRNVLAMHYFSGASFFIRFSHLTKLGGLPDKNDDILLGYYHTLDKGTISVLNSYSYSCLPNSSLSNYFYHRVRILDMVFTRNESLVVKNKNKTRHKLISIYSFLRDHYLDYATFPVLAINIKMGLLLIPLLMIESLYLKKKLGRKIHAFALFEPILCSFIYFLEINLYILAKMFNSRMLYSREPTAK